MGRPREFDEEDVIERAMQQFWSHGYANTSPAGLAEATGVAKGSLYNAFGGKRELYDRALARYDMLAVQIGEEFLSRPGGTREVIGALLRHLVEIDLAGVERRGCLAVNTAVEFGADDPEMRRAVRRMSGHTISALAERIDQGRRDGDVGSGVDPQATAEFLMNTIVGLRVMARTYDADTLHTIIDTALTCI